MKTRSKIIIIVIVLGISLFVTLVEINNYFNGKLKDTSIHDVKKYPPIEGIIISDDKGNTDHYRISELDKIPCEEFLVIPEWKEITSYTMAYDKRYAECRMMETHEESQLVKLDGNRYHIYLELNNAKVIDSEFSKNSNSLILNLDTLDNGLMSITIPRDLYSYLEDIPSNIPFILQNGEEIGYADSSDDINFIIQFNFTHPDPTIEIVGTFYP